MRSVRCRACRQYRMSERTNADNVELETALEQLLLDLGGDGVEADVALGEHAGLLLGVHRRHLAELVWLNVVVMS